MTLLALIPNYCCGCVSYVCSTNTYRRQQRKVHGRE